MAIRLRCTCGHATYAVGMASDDSHRHTALVAAAQEHQGPFGDAGSQAVQGRPLLRLSLPLPGHVQHPRLVPGYLRLGFLHTSPICIMMDVIYWAFG